MKVKINFEKEIEHCRQCPHCIYYAEQGFRGFYCCSETGYIISEKENDINKDCPFLKNF